MEKTKHTENNKTACLTRYITLVYPNDDQALVESGKFETGARRTSEPVQLTQDGSLSK